MQRSDSDIVILNLFTRQGASAKGMNPRYAKFVLVHVPLGLDENTKEVLNLGSKASKDVESQNLKECYEGIVTKEIRMEERNIYCGAYNVLVLQDVWVALIHLEEIYVPPLNV